MRAAPTPTRAAPAFDTRGRLFLRGFQTTDDAVVARILTIFPSWYPSRTVHIHFKVRTDPAVRREHELTSQLYFDDVLAERVLAAPPGTPRAARADAATATTGPSAAAGRSCCSRSKSAAMA